MKRNTWTWSISCNGNKYFAHFQKGTLADELLASFAGWLLGRGFYRLGCRLIEKHDETDRTVLTIQITEEQARLLGWDL